MALPGRHRRYGEYGGRAQARIHQLSAFFHFRSQAIGNRKLIGRMVREIRFQSSFSENGITG